MPVPVRVRPYNPAVPARVFAADADRVGQTLALSAEEAAHVARVLRLRSGDAVHVFDGRGREWAARIASSRGAHVEITLETPIAAGAEPQVRYTIAVAVLKGDGTDDVVRDAVMMGAARVRPFVAARSEVRLAALARGGRIERWQRIAVASAKQCGRAVVPPIDAPIEFGALVAADDDGGARLLLAEPSRIDAGATAIARVPRPAAATLAVGPEGGWNDEEVAGALRHGWTAVRLGRRTLRAVSVPLAALAACQAVWDDA